MSESLFNKIKAIASKNPALDKVFRSMTDALGLGTVVGLSIGTSSVKIVELKKTGKIWKLVHFGMVQLPEESVVNREITNTVAVMECIKTLLTQIQLGNNEVCSSVSGSFLIIKRMNVEAPNVSELKEQVYWEAEQYLPFDVAEVVMDFHVISRSKTGQTDVILVAAKRSVIESYMGCIDGSGLIPAIVDIDFFALQNLYEVSYPSSSNEAVAIVDVGASAMKMVVVAGGVPVFTKDSDMGGKNLTTEIQRSLNLSFADAEALKTGGSGDGTFPQEVVDLMGVMSENLATELKKSLDFYSASSAGPPVSSILIAGGGSKLPDLSQIIEDQVGLPTQLFNPFINAITYDPSVFSQEYLSQIGPLAVVPLGLALRAGAK